MMLREQLKEHENKSCYFCLLRESRNFYFINQLKNWFRIDFSFGAN